MPKEGTAFGGTILCWIPAFAGMTRWWYPANGWQEYFMNNQPWWLWIAKIAGTITFLLLIIDFFVAKRKIPFFVIAISLIAFGGGVVYAVFGRPNIVDFFFISLLLLSAPIFMWFMCGGSVFLKSRHNKDIESQRQKNED